MNEAILKAIELSRRDARNVFAKNTKIMEEVGEFAEALLHKEGYLPHKTMKEPLEGEVADIILCVLDTMAETYKDKTPTELLEMILLQMGTKTAKWDRILTERINAGVL